jgi:hypothetical protein
MTKHVRRLRELVGSELLVVSDGRITARKLTPDQHETTECGWFAIEELPRADLGPFAGSTFEAMGWIYI